MFQFVELSFYVFLTYLCIVVTRDYFVFKIRRWYILCDKSYPNNYKKLPSYESMVFNVFNWNKWTIAQWKRWSDKK